MVDARQFALSSLVVLCTVSQIGCWKSDQITRYRVKKPDGIVAAIIQNGGQMWFFKMAGPRPEVSVKADAFRTFIESVRFSGPDDQDPTWQLPDGWRRQPGEGMRHATLQIGADDRPLELTVIALPLDGDDPDQQILMNVNRWRGQLGLPAIERSRLPEETDQLAWANGTARLFDRSGHLGPTPGATAGASTGPPPMRRPPGPAAANLSRAPTYETPEGWNEVRAAGMRKAAFEVRVGQQQAEITIIDLPEKAGGLFANVDRWHDQVGLGRITQEQFDRQVQEIDVGGKVGHYVELVGPEDAEPRKSILGVIVVAGGKSWFVKLTGDAPLAEREKGRFKSFVQSIRFDGADDGK